MKSPLHSPPVDIIHKAHGAWYFKQLLGVYLYVPLAKKHKANESYLILNSFCKNTHTLLIASKHRAGLAKERVKPSPPKKKKGKKPKTNKQTHAALCCILFGWTYPDFI